MKIIYPNSFLSKYKKIVFLLDLEKLSKKIGAISLITLKFPYLKVKLRISWLSIRWVVLKTKGWNMIFLILCLKKDKKCWYNLTYISMKSIIITMEEKAYRDIQSKNYQEFIV